MDESSEPAAEREPTTTLSLYVSDLRWLQGKQREIMGMPGVRYMPMPDVIRSLVAALKRAEEGV